jgi:hypothetical protein
MEETAGQELSGEIAGQKFSMKNLPVNTIATVATLILVGIVAAVLYQHESQSASRDIAYIGAIKDQTSAMREQSQALRENTCVQSYQGPVPDKAAFCKSVTR